MAIGYPGQPLNPKSVLPGGMSMDQLYMAIAGAAALFCIFWLFRQFGPRKKTTNRIRVIQERRRELQGEFLGPKRRSRHSPDTSVNFMRSVANKWQLVKKLQIGK